MVLSDCQKRKQYRRRQEDESENVQSEQVYVNWEGKSTLSPVNKGRRRRHDPLDLALDLALVDVVVYFCRHSFVYLCPHSFWSNYKSAIMIFTNDALRYRQTFMLRFIGIPSSVLHFIQGLRLYLHCRGVINPVL